MKLAARPIPILALFLMACSYGLCQPPGSAPLDRDDSCDLAEHGCVEHAGRDCVAQAGCLRFGWRGHPADTNGARSLYVGECERGTLYSCQQGAQYLKEVLHDFDGATALLQHECDAVPQYCEELGDHYWESGAANHDKAIAEYKRACAANANSRACRVLAQPP